MNDEPTNFLTYQNKWTIFIAIALAEIWRPTAIMLVILAISIALPLALLFNRTEMDDTILGLAIVHTTLALPFAVLITFSLCSGIPIELEEAGWTMGCTRFYAFRKVVFPLILPGIAASVVFAFVISCNEIFAASV